MESAELANQTPPVTIPVNLEGIPDYLKRLDQWVLWQWENRKGNWTKPLKKPNFSNARNNDPNTWSTFEAVVEAYKTGRFSGIGFVFAEGDGLVGIDLDHCYEGGTIESWAVEIVNRFPGCFVERSPRDGLHIWVVGDPLNTKAFSRKNEWFDAAGKKRAVEFFDHSSARYFTVTGVSPLC